MISAQYGWTDETIFDLHVGRLRQVSAAIEERLKIEAEVRAADVEWSTKTISQFVAAAAMTGKGKSNPLAKEAAAIEHPLLKARGRERREARTSETPDVPLPDDVDPAIARAVAKNKPGSFEALMRGM